MPVFNNLLYTLECIQDYHPSIAVQNAKFPLRLRGETKLLYHIYFYFFCIKGSCKKVSSCALSEWTSWSSSPNPNQCIKQNRVREIIAAYIYEGQQTNCDGITDKCVFGNLEDERVLCKSC